MSGSSDDQGRTPSVRLPEVPLVTRILGAFLVVLALASLVTLVLENRLTRSQLQTSALEVVQGQVDILRALVRDREASLAQGLRTTREVLAIQTPDVVRDPEALIPLLLDLKRTFSLDVINAFTVDGLPLATAPGPRVESPPGELIASMTGRQTLSAVAMTLDGTFASVLVAPIQQADDVVVLVAGYLFEDATALALRSQSGTADVILVVDGLVAGSTLSGAAHGSPAPGWGRERPGVVRVGDDDVVVEYAPIARTEDEWTHDADVGVAAPEPLTRLDESLYRNRIAMIAVLILLAGLLSLIVTGLLTRPLRRLAQTASAIAGGDLSASFQIDRRDEIGALSRSLERMRRALRSQLSVIRRQTRELQAAAARIVGAQDEERLRVSHALHDGVQQQLVMLRLHLGVAEQRLRDDPLALGEVTADLRDDIDAVLERLRETSQDLYPSILRDRGLQGALFSLAGRSDVALDVVAEPDPLPRLRHEVEASAYFLVAEAVTNALKHAAASRIGVEVAVDESHLRVRVHDDGRGFDPRRVDRRGGLLHLRDRANAVGGMLQITSARGQGTTIAADFPLSVSGPLEEEEHGGDTPVDLQAFGESQLAEDRV